MWRKHSTRNKWKKIYVALVGGVLHLYSSQRDFQAHSTEGHSKAVRVCGFVAVMAYDVVD